MRGVHSRLHLFRVFLRRWRERTDVYVRYGVALALIEVKHVGRQAAFCLVFVVLQQSGGLRQCCRRLPCSASRFLCSQHLCLLAQLKASLAEQLSVEQLREEFRRYIRTKVAQELVDFYLDSLDREEVTGFFERQVSSNLHGGVLFLRVN